MKLSKDRAWVAEVLHSEKSERTGIMHDSYVGDAEGYRRVMMNVCRRRRCRNARNRPNRPTRLETLVAGINVNRMWWEWALQHHFSDYRLKNLVTGETIPVGILM